MATMLLLLAVSSVELLNSFETINVTVCNQGGVGNSVVAAAKAEVERVYWAVGVQVAWHPCDEFADPERPSRVPWFLIRLRNDKPLAPAGPASLAVMGRAFVGEREEGTVADAYFREIRATAEQDHADAGALLGFVIAHELGHLLLGPGHEGEGVMRAEWGHKEIDAVRQRRLWFTRDGAQRIREVLAARK